MSWGSKSLQRNGRKGDVQECEMLNANGMENRIKKEGMKFFG